VARLRLVFALLAAAMLGATALLAQRALRAAEVERSARHETLAARLSDEMELALSTFLRREEERPVGHYGFTYAADVALASAPIRLRSPLSRLPSDPEAPFVVGWFQIDADGVHSPLLPRESDPASGAPPDDAARASAARVRQIVERALAAPAEGRLAADHLREAVTGALAAPGGSAPSADARRQNVAEADEDAARAKREDDAFAEPKLEDAAKNAPVQKAQKEARLAKDDAGGSAYDVLQSLNRGGLERQTRERKVVANEAAPPPPSAAAPVDGVVASTGSPAPPEPEAPPAPGARAEATPLRDAVQRITVDPFVGRGAGDHLLLVRTVWIGERGSRQGLVLDVAALARWLRDRALGSVALPGARLVFDPGGIFEEGAVGSAPFTSRHRFVEPFDAIAVEVALAPLPDGPGEQAVLALAGLLVLAAGGGLFAIYRMVTVRLAFAQRRSNFAAAVSHELKTPLTAIRMYVEMLRDGLVPSEEKRREYYATLGAESERLSRLIDNVLEFSRLERGTRQLELRSAALGPVLEDLLALLRPHAERQGFAIELTLEGDLPPVRLERDALAQILFNLVENALKYARGAGDRTVSVHAAAQEGKIALSVRDRGPGVPDRRLARIFEPFYRGENELTRETQGSGIGLALVKGLAERMGATVSAKNPPGGGFVVTLLLTAA
jgi:signal transduction histidine kinase